MKIFNIEVQEFLTRVVKVKANNIEDAFSKVEERYRSEEIVLDYNDFSEVNFIDINTKSKRDEIDVLIKEVINYLYDERKKYFEESENSENNIFSKLERLKLLVEI